MITQRVCENCTHCDINRVHKGKIRCKRFSQWVERNSTRRDQQLTFAPMHRIIDSDRLAPPKRSRR